MSGRQAPSRIWAGVTGRGTNGGAFDQTLAQKWNGTHWTLVTSPDKGTGNNELNGVSCASTAFCMGAGDYRTAASLDRTLIEKW